MTNRARVTTTVLMLLASAALESLAFVPQKQRQQSLAFSVERATTVVPPSFGRSSTSRLYFFGRDGDKKDAKDDKDEGEDSKSSFFGNLLNRGGADKDKELGGDSQKQTEPVSSSATTTATRDPPPAAHSRKEDEKTLSPSEQAAKLRSDAERMRLEAERMDAELTLRKIERLEKELTNAVKADKDDVNGKTKKDVEQLQREINALLSKVTDGGAKKTNGESSSGSSAAAAAATVGSSSTTSSSPTTAEVTSTFDSTATKADINVTSAIEKADIITVSDDVISTPVWPEYVKPFDQKKYNEVYNNLKDLPQIILGAMALAVDVKPAKDPETGKTLVNATELALALDSLKRLDFSYSRKPIPYFSASQIADKAAKVPGPKEGKSVGGPSILFPTLDVGDEIDDLFDEPRFVELHNKDPMKYAKLVLETEYYLRETADLDDSADQLISIASEEPVLKAILSGAGVINGTIPTAMDSTIKGLYPKCTTKIDADQPTKQPSEAQVNQLIADVLPKASFQASSKPEPVLGGYIIRGTTNIEKGDDFIDKLDKVMERSSLKDKMTVLYQADFKDVAEETDDFNPFEEAAPILYVVGPEICREPRPVQLAIVSGLGLATSWYLSIFPFLLNPALAARVDEQLALADASMTPDLAFLTDLSLPLFTTFLGIQLFHELAHLVVAGSKNIKTSVPCFVPSLITGITSTVTTFKEPPKNKAAMFDFSVSGPLAGMVASVIALVVGSQLTAISDPASFPALPLEILRQSTLGGGIIEGVLGNDVLAIPEGARGTALVNGMTVPLHPVALAGYFGLVVNALALLPIGTTDGGRVALSLFGRIGKPAVGTLFFMVLLFAGLVGSDLLLFYFSFCIAFQAGNEVPARNEVDKLDIPRVFLATATYVFAALALIPF